MNYAETIDYLFNKTLVFQHVGAQAYKPGLDTTLQLDQDFRERIRVDGKMVSEEFVCSFVDEFLNSGYSGRQPSFFELATIMAFKYFEHEKVDVAVIEVGLG